MKSLKAIVAGSIFIVVTLLFMQLAFIFVAVGYNYLAKYYPFLNDITGYFRFIIGIPAFMLIMFIGGYITAYIANTNVLLHCLAVGMITTGAMMLSALENSDLTTTGIVITILALVATIAGGLYRKKQMKEQRSSELGSRG